MLEPLWGKSLYSRSQALCEVLPGKAWAGTVEREAVRGSLTCGPFPLGSHWRPQGTLWAHAATKGAGRWGGHTA